jgi:hypothetical protein
MKGDPLRLELLRELRALRRSPQPLGLDQIAGSARLTEIAGNGSPEQAHTTLLDLHDQQSYLGESDILTFFATCGIGAAGDTLDARLADIAAKQFVDPRTVLRHSNIGADKLSAVVRDMSLLHRPLGRINLIQKGNAVTCQVLIRLPKHSKYRRPDVYIDGATEKLQDLEWTLVDDPRDTDWLTATETFRAPLRVTTKTDRYTPVWSIAVYWLMPVWASWATAMEVSDSRLSSVLSVTRNYRAELALYFDVERSNNVKPVENA